MENTTDIDNVYTAGLLDGEGSIIMSAQRTLDVRIANTNRPVLDWLVSKYGGSICWRDRGDPRHKPSGEWVITCGKALPVLQAIAPYLKIKRKRAVLMIMLEQWRTKYELPRTHVREPMWASNVVEWVWSKMRAANARGRVAMMEAR